MVLPADYQPTKVMEPGEKSFHSPTSAVAAKRTSVLCRYPAHSAMRCDQFDAIAFGQFSIQVITVIGSVADQSRRDVIEEAVSEDAFDEWLSCGEALSILTATGRL